MAKITDDKKLPLGVELEVAHTQGNLAKVATALSGSIDVDQRQDKRARFSMTFSLNRATGTDAAPLTWRFSLPPLQEYLPSITGGYLRAQGTPFHNIDLDINTPTVLLEAISIGFDTANTSKKIQYTGGTAGYASANSHDNAANIELSVLTKNNNQARDNDKEVVASLAIETTELANPINRGNPKMLRDLNININPYSIYQLQYTSADVAGDNALVVRLVFSHPIVERDMALSYASNAYPQNSPGAAYVNRNNDSVTLAAPAAGATIRAAGTTGLQTHIETLDQKFQDQLHAGRFDRYTHNSSPSNFAQPKEQLSQDSSYFCWNVNLLKTDAICTGTNATYWEQNDAPGGSPSAFWFFDRAIIPITFPGTIHHVLVDVGFDPIRHVDTSTPGATAQQRQLQVGVGLGTGIKTQTKTYQQIAYNAFNLGAVGTTGLLKGQMYAVPLVFETGVTGRGWAPQGRPVYFGRQVHFDGTHDRQNAAFAVNTGTAEGAPKTAGLEQFIEVRLFYMLMNSGLSANITAATGNAADVFWNQAGVNVYIIGKMDLAR
tara:strand:+ start:1947 stop:3590 length:1644 start_codon:yes stop_codon:yes gene_type:complete